jgi:3-methyladenine DNA glycosylase AlkD
MLGRDGVRRRSGRMRDVTARDAERLLRRAATPARAAVLQRFFKTGAGQYGEGDRFLGVTMPQIRSMAADCRAMPLGEIETLLESPWHEARMLALVILAARYPRASAAEQRAIYRLYLRRTDRINNWDLVDVTAPAIVGGYLLNRSPAPLRRLARSKNLWERRIAIIATQHFIRGGRFDVSLELAASLLTDRHDLMHKAVGWMLREIGNRDEPALRRFLHRHASAMPRTALRYAIERLPPAVRTDYLRRKTPRPAARN